MENDSLEARGLDPSAALAALRSSSSAHDPLVLRALAELRAAEGAFLELREIRLHEIASGMVLADDLRSTTGVLLAPRGFEVSEASVARFRNFRTGTIHEPIHVLVPAAPHGGERSAQGNHH